MLNKFYYIKKKKQNKTGKKKERRKNKGTWKPCKKIFLLLVLKIPFILLHKYDFKDRCKFSYDHTCLSKLYKYLLKYISLEINLTVKFCWICGISYIPDYRSKNHQKCCPYGCVELNRRINKQKAKSRYRKTKKALFKASEHNGRYRDRKRRGDVLAVVAEIDCKTEEADKKLRSQIKFLYKRLNPHVSNRKIKQLDRILRKISCRAKTS